jgi:hypothetical protein
VLNGSVARDDWRTATGVGTADAVARRLAELRGLLVEEDHPAIGFALRAIDVVLAVRTGRFEDADVLARDLGGRIRATPTATCTRNGRRWRVQVGTRAALVDHGVGMLHLAVLTANPGVEVPAIELAAGVRSIGRALLSAQPVLDPTAVRQYRRRLSELREEIDGRESDNDNDNDNGDESGDERAARAKERDWLLDELAAGTGPGGRVRAFVDDRERARIAVGRAIRRAIARITRADALVGTHLSATVHTGMSCWYRPA